MNVAPVVDFLRQRIGLDPESLGLTALPRAIAGRMKELGISSLADYAARLADDPVEFQKLAGQIMVPETWFFRGGEVFSFLASHAAKCILLWGGTRKFRALSLPCSTGEEPYSLAIAFDEAGISAQACHIEALDLCSQHLEKAERACYSEFSFRQTKPALRERYFQFQQGTWTLNQDIKNTVHFGQANLLDPLLLAAEAPFDLILCRNLLIYLHKDARRQVLDALDRLLAPEGWLCMGHAEPLEFLDTRFKRVGPEGFFIYERSQAVGKSSPPPVWSEFPSVRLDRPMSIIVPEGQPSQLASASIHEGLPGLPVDRMIIARRFADNGKLDEALAACQAQLAQTGPSADLFGLMGVVHQARHEKEDAARYYQRALYLDPAHLESLTHLMLLCQEQGDIAQVARLRKRLERAAQGGEA
jgi:chemotaxis protein methyltransferase WspC